MFYFTCYHFSFLSTDGDRFLRNLFRSQWLCPRNTDITSLLIRLIFKWYLIWNLFVQYICGKSCPVVWLEFDTAAFCLLDLKQNQTVKKQSRLKGGVLIYLLDFSTIIQRYKRTIHLIQFSHKGLQLLLPAKYSQITTLSLLVNML